MTIIKIFRRGGDIVEVEIKGHTGYAKAGRDIVCSAVSTLAQGALLGLAEVAGVKTESTKGEEIGYLNFRLAEEIKGEKRIKAQAILETMYLGLKDLEKSYPRHIRMEA